MRGGGEAFQEAAQLDLIVFDKTGTLTEGGEPQVTDVELVLDETPWNRESVLSIAHALESASSHPLATAMRRYCEAQKDIKLVATSSGSVEETAGRGLKGNFTVPSCEAIIGNESWIEEHGSTFTASQENLLRQWQSEGKSVIALAARKGPSDRFVVVAIFAAADRLREEACGVVRALQEHGLDTWMISGDNERTAKAVAKTAGIPETNVIAGVLPQQKAEKINWLQKVGRKRDLAKWKRILGMKRLNERCVVAMVGDGINDAPVSSISCYELVSVFNQSIYLGIVCRRRERCHWLWQRCSHFKCFLHPDQVRLAKSSDADGPLAQGLQACQVQFCESTFVAFS